MVEYFSRLKEMQYPGRGVLVGRTANGVNILGLFLTGRGPESQDRKIMSDGREFFVRGKNEEADDPLRHYCCYKVHHGTAFMTNGRQTDAFINRDNGQGSLFLRMAQAMENPYLEGNDDLMSYEDDNYHTPRVSASMQGRTGVLAIVSAESLENKAPRIRELFDVPLRDGHGSLITTYTGDVTHPLAYNGGAIDVRLDCSPAEVHQRLWNSLDENLRVATLVIEPALLTGSFHDHYKDKHAGKNEFI